MFSILFQHFTLIKILWSDIGISTLKAQPECEISCNSWETFFFFPINSRRRNVWHRNTPFIQILAFVGIPVECADILWLAGYLNMSCVSWGEAIPAQHLGISSSWSFQPKAPCWETFWTWLQSIDYFYYFSVEILCFSSNPIIFLGKITTFMYIYFLQVT